MEAQKKAKRKFHKNTSQYKSYVHKMLKNMDNVHISSAGLDVIESFIQSVIDRIANEAGQIARMNQRQTIGKREMLAAVRLVLMGDLLTHAEHAGTVALSRYHQSVDKKE